VTLRPARVPGVRGAISRLARTRDDVVLFQAWHGVYADNPRGIAEELQRRDAPLRHVWAIEGDGADVPDGATIVRPGSARYLEQLGRARYVVANNALPGYFRKKPGVTYVQTWHGTPLKRIAFDIPGPAFSDGDRYLRNLGRDVAGWDYLVSPNAFSSGVFRRAFRYTGPVLETGYPRNDVLSRPEAPAVRAAVRASLGLGERTRAVLYAPTWRDGAAFSSELDLARMADALGDEHVILLRAHSLVADTVAAQGHPRVLDVSQHADVRDLYLAADVLITDYSSTMFDFAVTGKPMLFFTYDLADYRDRLRGFYFDLTAEAPGPLLETTGDVVAALRDLDAVCRPYAAAYARFAATFCSLEDGGAAARVVDAVFAR
jgi:CDP-glycerol glycerophosphotransferase